jgi:hypothetical protein
MEMRQALYPKEKYCNGHPHLAEVLNNLGALLSDQGDYASARDYLEQARAMRQALYPKWTSAARLRGDLGWPTRVNLSLKEGVNNTSQVFCPLLGPYFAHMHRSQDDSVDIPK